MRRKIRAKSLRRKGSILTHFSIIIGWQKYKDVLFCPLDFNGHMRLSSVMRMPIVSRWITISLPRALTVQSDLTILLSVCLFVRHWRLLSRLRLQHCVTVCSCMGGSCVGMASFLLAALADHLSCSRASLVSYRILLSWSGYRKSCFSALEIGND